MFITKKSLARRSLLRGMGVAIGLPFLDAMQPALAQTRKSRPVRMVYLYLPNGVDMANWNPTYTGPHQELPRILKPLEPFRKDMMLLGNLTHNYARPLLDGAGDHGRCSANYLTGAHVRKTATDIHVSGPMSADQLVASRIGSQTRLPSLEIGMEDPRQSGSCDSGYSCAYTNNLAWKNETQPLPPILDPRMLFERLFGANAGLTPAERREKQLLRSSVLDFVQESTGKLKGELGPTDRRKLDEYLQTRRRTRRLR
jgi:hypothetical protein